MCLVLVAPRLLSVASPGGEGEMGIWAVCHRYTAVVGACRLVGGRIIPAKFLGFRQSTLTTGICLSYMLGIFMWKKRREKRMYDISEKKEIRVINVCIANFGKELIFHFKISADGFQS